jgi:hypothetical protein
MIEIDENLITSLPERELRKLVFQEDENGNRYRERIIAEIEKFGVGEWAFVRGFPTNQTAFYKNRYTGELFRLMDDSFYLHNQDSPCPCKSWEEWIEKHFYYTWENNLPEALWNEDNFNKPAQSTVFDTKVVEKVSPINEESDEKLSDEELAEKYPVESGEVEDEPNSDEEPIEEEFVEQKNEQVSLFGSSPVKKVDKIKLLEAQKQDLWDLEWVKRTLEIVAEIDSGKVFDKNEVDGLYRDFEIGSAGYEELGVPEEDFEKLGYEQYVKKCLQHSLKFQTEELGIDVEKAKELTHESIEEQINELDKQIEAEKELQRSKKVQKCNKEAIVQVALQKKLF